MPLPSAPPSRLTRVALGADSTATFVEPASTGRLSAADLRPRVVARAESLARAGVGAGDVVALLALPGSAFAVDALALWSLDAAVYALDAASGDWEVDRRLAAIDARWRIAELGGDPEHLGGAPRAVGPAFITSTSGTTGPPKVIGLTADHLAAAAGQMADRLGSRRGDVLLAGLPVFHVAGFVLQFTSGLLGGWTQVVLPRFSAADAWELMAEYRVTHTHVVPRMVEMLLAAPRDLPDLRWVSCGAAPLAPALAESFASAAGVPVLRGYGLSETGAVAHHVAPGEEGGPRHVGTAVRGARTRILDDDGRELPPGEVGEIHLSGPQVASGYWGRPAFPGGWLPTGDLGFLDEAGRLTISGREKEVIRYNGHQVFPTELEELLRSHPAVADALVSGRPDASAGEIPIAHVVTRADVTDEQLLAFVADHVAPYRRLRAIEFVASIDRGPLGKARPAADPAG